MKLGVDDYHNFKHYETSIEDMSFVSSYYHPMKQIDIIYLDLWNSKNETTLEGLFHLSFMNIIDDTTLLATTK